MTGTSGKQLKICVSRKKNQSQLCIPRKPRKIGVWVSGAEIQTSAVDIRTAVWVSTAEKNFKIVLGETRNFSQKFRGVSAPALYKTRLLLIRGRLIITIITFIIAIVIIILIMMLGTPRPGTECSRALRARNPKRVRKESERVPRGLRLRGAPESPKSAPRSPKRVQKESEVAFLDSFRTPGRTRRGTLIGLSSDSFGVRPEGPGSTLCQAGGFPIMMLTGMLLIMQPIAMRHKTRCVVVRTEMEFHCPALALPSGRFRIRAPESIAKSIVCSDACVSRVRALIFSSRDKLKRSSETCQS